MAVAATTVKKPSENSPNKRARRRRYERKQTPQNRVRTTEGKSWEKTVEAARLHTEQEKVAFSDLLGIDRKRLPRRIYQGANGNQTSYFALKLPIACDANSSTFVYVDPSKDTDTELRSWGDAHEWLWRALRLKGIEVQVVVIGADHTATIRAETALQTWSKRAGEPSGLKRECGEPERPGRARGNTAHRGRLAHRG